MTLPHAALHRPVGPVDFSSLAAPLFIEDGEQDDPTPGGDVVADALPAPAAVALALACALAP